MSEIITQNDEQVNGQASESVVTPNGATGDAIPTLDAATAEKMAKDDAGIAKIIALAITTLDPKDMLKKYARLGKAALDHALWQKAQFPAFNEEDYDRLCDKVATQVKFQVAIKSVRISDYIRVHTFVECVRPMVSDVEKLSYFQVANKFLPMLSFSKSELHGKIKDDWVDFVKDAVARQIGDSPMTIKELDAAIEKQKQAIASARNAEKSPAQLQDAEHKKQVAEQARKESKVRTEVTMSVDEALSGTLHPTQLMAIVEKVAADRKVTLPVNIAAFSHMTPLEAKMLAKSLWDANNIAAMKVLRDQLDIMVKTFENATVTSKVG